MICAQQTSPVSCCILQEKADQSSVIELRDTDESKERKEKIVLMPGPDQSGGGSVASPVPTTPAASQGRTKLPPSRFQTYLNSGSKKHVFFGLLIISAVTSAPYFLLTSGAQHQNHADYMDAAEKARQSRLSSSST